MTILLEVRSVRKSFAGVHALKGVSFDVAAGEVHALVGENGAGKSTLLKVMTGAHRPDTGTVSVGDREVRDMDPARARAMGVAAIYQQPALFPDLSVAENVALGVEAGGAWRVIDWRGRRERAARLLEQIGARIDPDAHVASLSMPEQQLVEIARALGARARVLIMDEPTASLTDTEVTRLLAVVRELRSQGVGIVYISHRLEEVFAIADRVTVLRDGETVATRPVSEVDRGGLIALMVGRAAETPARERSGPPGDVVLEAKGLGCESSGVRDVHFSLRVGEVLGLAGLVGSGRSELARILFGLTPATAGEIRLRGRAIRIESAEAAVAAGLAYVPEDRRRHGVVLDMSVAANTSLAVLDRMASHGLLDFPAERRLADGFVESLSIKTSSLDVPVATLSGGNQQKVSLARWLATKPSVIILDEPTQGVDVGAKAEFHRLIRALAAQGMAVLMISSDMPEVLGLSDRVGVMREGRLVGILGAAEATPEGVLALALGQHAPLPPTEPRA